MWNIFKVKNKNTGIPFYIPWKHQKNYGFPMFSEGIKREYWCFNWTYFTPSSTVSIEQVNVSWDIGNLLS